MSIQKHLEQWCQTKGMSLDELSQQSGVEFTYLQGIQQGEWDPPLSTLMSIATSLEIPVAWLFSDPLAIQRLWNDPDDDEMEFPPPQSPDPLLHRILQESQQHPELFTLLTSLIHHGDPKLIRAVHVNLQSLMKQARNTTIPWGSRPPGHFEPPSD